MRILAHKFTVLKDVLKNDKELCRNFGFYIAFLHFLMKVVFRGDKTSIGRKLYKHIYHYCQRVLTCKYSDFIDEYRELKEICLDDTPRDCPIWIFWWQGEEQAPKIVKTCIQSVRRHNPDCEIILVTKDNYKEYADLPDYIMRKVKAGCISLTHFSDILRLELLYRNGGIWIDATLWMTGSISDEVFTLPFYTIKHEKYADYHVCRGKWSTFFMCSARGNTFIKYSRDFLYRYWETQNFAICYLIIDVVFCIAYDNFIWTKKLIDNIPVNNTVVFEMQKHMNCVYREKEFEEWKKRTFCHKVSYKIPFKYETPQGITYWGFLNKK